MKNEVSLDTGHGFSIKPAREVLVWSVSRAISDDKSQNDPTPCGIAKADAIRLLRAQSGTHMYFLTKLGALAYVTLVAEDNLDRAKTNLEDAVLSDGN